MDIRVVYKSSFEPLSDTLILPFYEGVELSDRLISLDDSIESMISYFVREEIFTGKYKEIESFRLPGEENPKNIILAGLGKEEELTLDKIRVISARAIKKAIALKSKSAEIHPVGITSEISIQESVRALVESSILQSYSFDKYKSDRRDPVLKELNILHKSKNHPKEIEAGAMEGKLLAECTVFARDLVNEPANFMTPKKLADETYKVLEDTDVDITVYGIEKIKALKMEAYMSVSNAASNEPQFIIMKYTGNQSDKDQVFGLVGKGLTYDSGGLSLKPTSSMIDMKSDMGGAASVIGAMAAISKAKLPINVVAVIAACENMIGPDSYRPGDIIGSMAGKTIEVGNTDAEGRLTLVDAIHYVIEKEKATMILDIATLTGAVLSALGTEITGVLSNDDDFYQKLQGACELSGEKIWRLPAYGPYNKLLKSDVADMKNVGGKYAGTITAGLFIKKFVQDKPWIHMDIAGTSWAEKVSDCTPKGGTGAGLRSIYFLLKDMSSSN